MRVARGTEAQYSWPLGSPPAPCLTAGVYRNPVLVTSACWKDRAWKWKPEGCPMFDNIEDQMETPSSAQVIVHETNVAERVDRIRENMVGT